MDGKCGEMYASGCIIFGERKLGSVTVSGPVSVSHGNLYKVEMNKDIIKVRKQILDSFLENLAGISDKEYQKRVWIEGRGPECDDFVETVCDFFDLGEYIFDNYEGYNITEPQQKILNEFRKEFKAFSDEKDFPEKFIDTPEWTKITEMAKEILKVFNYKNRV